MADTVSTRIRITGTADGLSGGGVANIGGNVMENSGAEIGQTVIVPLASGDNVIALPTGCLAVYVALPSDNLTITVLLKQDAGDVGWRLHKSRQNLITTDEDSPETALILNASGALAGVRVTFA